MLKYINEKLESNSNYIWFCVLILFLACLVSLFLVSNFYAGIPTGDSMKPVIHEGDLVIYEKVDSIDEVEVGDVIDYNSLCPRNSGESIVHAVISDTEYGLITHGYNTYDSDQLYDYSGNLIVEHNCEPPVTDKTIKGIMVFNTSNELVADLFLSVFS
jgi:signal peptidase I